MQLKLFRNEIIPVYVTSLGNKVVSARELYEYLGIKDKFFDWFKRRIKEHNLIENQDYCLISDKAVAKSFATVVAVAKQGRGGHNKKDYIIKLHPAKKIALGTNNENGDKVKEYFMACEQVVKNGINKPLNIEDYANKNIQKSLVKQVNNSLYDGDPQNLINHHKRNFKIHFGQEPHELKKKLVKKGLKVKSKSGREIARKIKPEAACSMAMHDDFVSRGHELATLEQKQLKDKLEPAFKAIIELGFIPAQLVEK
jgi:phage anti-repressor protein